MNEDTIPKSMGDFVTLLVREISQSLSLARYEARLIQVQRVRVRFGEPGGSDSVIVNRYPFMANGWDVELEMGSRIQARLDGELLPPVAEKPKLLDNLGDHPISDIKGVNTDWAGFFRQHKMTTIRSLAMLSMTGLQALARQRKSVKLWEVHAKARLLECEIPFFPSTPLDHETLYTLLKMPSATLLNRAGVHQTSTAEIERLSDTMELLAVVVDARVLQAMKLSQLRRG